MTRLMSFNLLSLLNLVLLLLLLEPWPLLLSDESVALHEFEDRKPEDSGVEDFFVLLLLLLSAFFAVSVGGKKRSKAACVVTLKTLPSTPRSRATVGTSRTWRSFVADGGA